MRTVTGPAAALSQSGGAGLSRCAHPRRRCAAASPGPRKRTWLTQACRAVLTQADAAAPGDLAEVLELLADASWHPGTDALVVFAARLEGAADSLPLPALCLLLWAFAIFAHVPPLTLQRSYANRIERDLAELSAVQVRCGTCLPLARHYLPSAVLAFRDHARRGRLAAALVIQQQIH